MSISPSTPNNHSPKVPFGRNGAGFTDAEKNMRLEGERLYLRSLSVKDATTTYAGWLNDPEIHRFLETKSATVESVKNYITEREHDPHTLFWGIFLKENDQHIGTEKIRFVDLSDIGLGTKEPELGIMIGERSLLGQGLGGEAMSLALRYAFDTLGFDHMTLGFVVGNERGERLYTRLGFTAQHLRKRFVCYDGVWYDHMTMLLTRERFVSMCNVHKV